jgi:hypothetical protein
MNIIGPSMRLLAYRLSIRGDALFGSEPWVLRTAAALGLGNRRSGTGAIPAWLQGGEVRLEQAGFRIFSSSLWQITMSSCRLPIFSPHSAPEPSRSAPGSGASPRTTSCEVYRLGHLGHIGAVQEGRVT